jgi:hypothetical protein
MRNIKWYTSKGKDYAIDVFEGSCMYAVSVYCPYRDALIYGFGFDEIGAVRQVLDRLSEKSEARE